MTGRAGWRVMQSGELPDPEPGPGEVRVRVRLSGVNPGDTKKRRGWLGSSMPFPRVIPHSDAAGVIDAVGQGVDRADRASRVGVRRAVLSAVRYRGRVHRRAGDLAVDLPDAVPDEIGACLGIPGITAHRAVFADGAVDGRPCSSTACSAAWGLAAQVAAWAGATVIGTVRRAPT